jgi:hypothetical protein
MNAPKIILTINPPLRKMICNGTEILYPSAKLFNTDTRKKTVTSKNQLKSGTTVGFNLGPYFPIVI